MNNKSPDNLKQKSVMEEDVSHQILNEHEETQLFEVENAVGEGAFMENG